MGSLPTPTKEQRLLILDTDLTHWSTRAGRILCCRTDGSDLHALLTDLTELPDGIAFDARTRHVYFTNMGASGFAANDGSIQRFPLPADTTTARPPPETTAKTVQTVVPRASTYTPKQITLAPVARKLYWSDREGMRVLRSNLDGSHLEMLVRTGSTAADRLDKARWCVGVAVDEARGYFYWTQKGPSKGGAGRILRARIDGALAAEEGGEAGGEWGRSDVEVLADGLPEPIDLELDEARQLLYWTDRGDPPRGNSVNRAFVGEGAVAGRLAVEVLALRLHETIGLAVDREREIVYATDLAGGVYRVAKGEKGEWRKEVLFSELGDLTGIALVEV